MNSLSEARSFGDVLRLNAARRPDKTALQTLDGRFVTFGGFNDRVNRLNDAVAQLGVRQGSRVAILSRNCAEYVESYGLSKSGLIVVPLNWRLTGEELTKLIAHSCPELLIVDELNRDLVERLRDTWTSVKHFVLLGAARAGWQSYEALIAAGSAAEPAATVRASDVLCVIYTSGTTGAPKGVAITHGGAIGNSRTAAADILQLSEHDRTMAVMPLFHAGGMWYHLFASFATGCTSLILADFEPATVIKELAAHRITNVHLVPSMVGALLAAPAAETADFSGLRLLFYAASSMPAHLLQRAIQRLSSCGFVQSYGSTEAGVVTVLSPDDHRRARQPQSEHLLSSCGRPVAGRAVRIVDDTGGVVAAGAVGEIELHSPDTMDAYWLDPEGTRNAMRDGWLKTGDLGYLDAQGFLYIVDRKSDMMITGGENVYPTEVEGYLYRDPDVLEAAVFGVPDPQWVERVVAAVVPKPGSSVTAEQLIARLRERLAPYKCPKTIHFVATLPKSAAGKVLRKALRKQFG